MALSKGACSNLACVEAEAGQPWLGVTVGMGGTVLGVPLSHLCPGLARQFTLQDPAPQGFCLPFLGHLRLSQKLPFLLSAKPEE